MFEGFSKNQLKDTEYNPTTFEETYKTAYSHGLESIYKLENVDLKTVRRLAEKTVEEAPKPTSAPLNYEESEELDLGPKFRKWIPSFVREEPIQVLQLNRVSEKCLLEHGFTTLHHLLTTDLSRLVYVKGMGQGHIDEIKHQLNKYSRSKPLYKAYQIDFVSWIKSLTFDMNLKKVYVLLEKYQLADLVSLTPMESVEVRKLDKIKKEEIFAEVLKEIRLKSAKVQTRFEDILQTFVIPWMERRWGMATEEEISERLQRISLKPSVAEKALLFFKEAFYEGQLPFHKGLSSAREIYFASSYYLKAFSEMEQSLTSYFYHPSVYYSLDELYRFLLRDYSLKWRRLEESFLIKLLTLHPHYTVFKDAHKVLSVQLSL